MINQGYHTRKILFAEYRSFAKGSIRKINSRQSFFILSTKYDPFCFSFNTVVKKSRIQIISFISSMTVKFYFNLGSWLATYNEVQVEEVISVARTYATKGENDYGVMCVMVQLYFTTDFLIIWRKLAYYVSTTRIISGHCSKFLSRALIMHENPLQIAGTPIYFPVSETDL